jgi:hypothetical protein
LSVTHEVLFEMGRNDHQTVLADFKIRAGLPKDDQSVELSEAHESKELKFIVGPDTGERKKKEFNAVLIDKNSGALRIGECFIRRLSHREKIRGMKYAP